MAQMKFLAVCPSFASALYNIGCGDQAMLPGRAWVGTERRHVSFNTKLPLFWIYARFWGESR